MSGSGIHWVLRDLIITKSSKVQFSKNMADQRILHLKIVLASVDFHQNGSGDFYSGPIFKNLTHSEFWQNFKDMGSFITTTF